MLDRRSILLGFAGTTVAALSMVAVCGCGQGKEMQEIKFDLGKNIVDTGRASGVPQFQIDKTNGLVEYSVNTIPAEIPAHYTRPGYEVIWRPLFAFTMYTDEKISKDRVVQSVDLQLDNTVNNTHEEAHAFMEQTVAQFQKGKWQRYCDLEWDTLLTGRSSLLNEKGEFERGLQPIDPDYKIPAADWPVVAALSPMWRWVGDGVVATYRVSLVPGSDARLDYRMSLEFELLDAKRYYAAKNLAYDLQQGDAKGWNSTVRYEEDKKKRLEVLKRLEANAIKRGDSVLTRH